MRKDNYDPLGKRTKTTILYVSLAILTLPIFKNLLNRYENTLKNYETRQKIIEEPNKNSELEILLRGDTNEINILIDSKVEEKYRLNLGEEK